MPSSYYVRDQGQDNVLQIIGEERELGVYVSANLKSSVQCRKATSILGIHDSTKF